MQRIVKLCGGVFLTLVLGLISVGAQEAAKAKEAAQTIDVALCLDVSGSMQGLIDSAKNKLWDIVNELAKAKPTPKLRVALYSYGHTTYDRNKGWVRKELDLTTDLDQLYQKLFALTINGGEEYVTRVCRDAIVEQKWSQEKNALKLIFVAGNEPANQDRTVSMKEVSEKAIAQGIIINTIYCGNPDNAEASGWRDLAHLAEGRYASINQNQRVVVNTPVDKDLAKLADEVNSTYVAYGKDMWKGKNQQDQTANSAKAGASVLASRVQAQNTALYQCEDWDLVDRCKKDPKFDITKVPDAELSETLKKLTPEKRVAYVKEMSEKRANLQKRIDDLTNQRNNFIREEMKRNPNPGARAFDEALRETLRIQAGAKGIQIAP